MYTTVERGAHNGVRLKMMLSAKTDTIDSLVLANMLRLNAIPRCHLYSEDSQVSLTLLRHRIKLVQERSAIVTRRHNMLDKYDHNLAGCGSTNMTGPKCLAFLREQTYEDPADAFVMEAHHLHIEFLNEQIRSVEKKIRERAAENPDAKLLMSMPGLDYFGALLIATAIDGIKRFGKPKKLISFLGLCPRVYQSGSSIKYGRMKKDADGALTWMMMEAAMTAVRYDSRLKALYEIKCKTHPPIVARSHVAKMMATIIHHMLTEQKPYEFRNEKTYQRKLARLKN